MSETSYCWAHTHLAKHTRWCCNEEMALVMVYMASSHSRWPNRLGEHAMSHSTTWMQILTLKKEGQKKTTGRVQILSACAIEKKKSDPRLTFSLFLFFFPLSSNRARCTSHTFPSSSLPSLCQLASLLGPIPIASSGRWHSASNYNSGVWCPSGLRKGAVCESVRSLSLSLSLSPNALLLLSPW